ncbi:MAG: hypothetical protein DPW17_02980 [Candidatus Jettenia sp.]|nr:hypothetical protein [Candidatus Jettenia sp.]
MGKGFLGVVLVSLAIFLNSCVTTQRQVKEAEEHELRQKETSAPVEPVPAQPEAVAPVEPAPEAVIPSLSCPR